MISDPREEKVKEYLDRKLPLDWYERDLDKRRDFLYGTERPLPDAPMRRDYVSAQEIWCECFGYNLTKMERKDAFTIKSIMAKMEEWKYSGERRRLGGGYGLQRIIQGVTICDKVGVTISIL